MTRCRVNRDGCQLRERTLCWSPALPLTPIHLEPVDESQTYWPVLGPWVHNTEAVSIHIRPATEADWEQIVAVDSRAFHNYMTEESAAFARQALELDRFIVAVDQDMVVAVCGAYSLQLTLPGGELLPLSGVTWVGVSVTHRRQGLLHKLMAALDQQATDRNEPLMGLRASEGGIYSRFGYGSVSRMREVAITQPLVRLVEPSPPPSGSVQILDGRDAVPLMFERWDRARRAHPGELSRTEADLRRRMHDAAPGVTVAVHADGFAAWTVAPKWTNGLADGTLDVLEFCAATPEAHEALWRTVLSVDLVGEITTQLAVTEHDRLPSLLIEPRIVRTTALLDGLWIKVLDPVTAFGARTYRTGERLVLACGEHRWSVSGAGCSTTDQPADLEVAARALGPLLMGGSSATELAGLGLCTPSTPDVLPVADALLGFEPRPISRLMF